MMIYRLKYEEKETVKVQMKSIFCKEKIFILFVKDLIKLVLVLDTSDSFLVDEKANSFSVSLIFTLDGIEPQVRGPA